MVLLSTAAALVTLSVVLFVVGLALDRPELAMLGAIVMIGVGGSAMVGEPVQVENGTVTAERMLEAPLEDITTSEHLQTRDVSSEDASPTGIAFDDTGSEMYISGAETAAVYQYSTSEWGLGVASYQRTLDVSGNDTTPTGLVVDGDGEWLVFSGDDTDSLYEYRMSDAYNISSASHHATLDVSAETVNPRSAEFADSGSDLYIADENNGEIDQYTLTDPYNISTASYDRNFTVSTQTGTPTGLAFSKDGNTMLVAGTDSENVYQYSLDTPYTVSSASYTGNSLDTSGEVRLLAGIEYEDGDNVILAPDRQDGELVEYDASSNETVTDRSPKYKTLDLHDEFPLGLVLVLVGSVMLMGGAGEASEEGRETPPWRRK